MHIWGFLVGSCIQGVEIASAFSMDPEGFPVVQYALVDDSLGCCNESLYSLGSILFLVLVLVPVPVPSRRPNGFRCPPRCLFCRAKESLYCWATYSYLIGPASRKPPSRYFLDLITTLLLASDTSLRLHYNAGSYKLKVSLNLMKRKT